MREFVRFGHHFFKIIQMAQDFNLDGIQELANK